MSSALETLRRDFGGDIIEPGGAEYESASRSVLTTGSPAYVLRPGTVGDVQAGVRFAASTGLLLSVRSGGHGFAGFGTNDGGVVIDLGRLANVEIIDTERHLVRIGGGATWGQVAAGLAPHGLAISSGDTKSVGVGGLTLTGGIGWMVRKHGLALDNVAAAEVVTASGEVVRASAAENPELFWAIRGGGGNFGIVTAFDFAAHPTTDVFYGAFAGKESVSEVLQILAEAGASERSPFIAVRSVGGAVSRVPGDATAYAHRQAELMVVTTSAGPKPAVEAARPALDAIWARLAPHVSGAYANFLSSATAEDVAAIYPIGDLSAARGGQASVRPRQSVRPQPQHPAALGLGDGTGHPGTSWG